MARFFYKQGICKIILNLSEGLIVNPCGADMEFILNQSEAWKIKSGEIRQIRVLTHEDLNYTPSPHLSYLQELFAQLGIEKGCFVDIGAHDGLNYSNTIDLVRQGWSGLAVECQPARFARLAEVYRYFSQVEAARHRVSPRSIGPLLQAFDIPRSFDFLSLDIDSYDYPVLAALLESCRPSVICTEINEVIPPPVRFAVKYDPDFALDLDTRFYGQSLAMVADLAQRYNYTLLHLHYMDVFLIDNQLISGLALSLEELYAQGVKTQPRPRYYEHYPFDVEALWQATPEQAIEMLKTGWPEHQKYYLSLKADTA